MHDHRATRGIGMGPGRRSTLASGVRLEPEAARWAVTRKGAGTSQSPGATGREVLMGRVCSFQEVHERCELSYGGRVSGG